MIPRVSLALSLSSLLLAAAIPGFAAAASEQTITAANLMEHEGAWPLQVWTTKEWASPDGVTTLKARKIGILYRVNDDGTVRLDFAAGGIHELPIDHTDVVERANAVAQGRRTKMAPNIITILGNRVLDGEAPVELPVTVGDFQGVRGFVHLVADPRSEGFAAIAQALRGVHGKYGVRTVVYPLGDPSNKETLELLRASQWRGLFVRPDLADAYRLGLSSHGEQPRVVVTTSNGRLLLDRAWDGDAKAAIDAALEQAFTDSKVAASE